MSTNGTNNQLKRHAPATVLVIDDESSVRDLITRWLTADGHACAQAATAQAAWEYLQAHEVHLVTLDIRMPGDSGIDLLHQIGRDLSRYVGDHDQRRGRNPDGHRGADLRGVCLPRQARQTRPVDLPRSQGARTAAIGR